MIIFFGSVYVVDYVNRLMYAEPALHPQDEAYLIVMDNLLGCAVTIGLTVFY